jgi:hypothetical protein
MDWTAVSAISQLVVALGVVASIFDLTKQLRESNRAARRASVEEVLKLNTDIMQQITRSTETSEIWAKGYQDLPMTLEETYHYYALLYSNILLWERMYFLNEDGLLDEWIWDDVSRQIDQRVGAKTFQRWFKAVRADSYNERWQAFLMARIEAANARQRAAALAAAAAETPEAKRSA